MRIEEGEGTVVDLDLPLRSLAATLDAYDADRELFPTSRLLAVLQTLPRGRLVRVVDGGDEVEIRRLW